MFGGGVWPVVQRELREAARRPLNHWLRVAGAGVGVIIFCLVTADSVAPILRGRPAVQQNPPTAHLPYMRVRPGHHGRLHRLRTA